MRVSLRTRFLLLLVCLLVALFATIATILVRQNTTTLRNNLTARSRSFAELATKPIGDAYLIYSHSGSFRIDQQISRFTELDKDISAVAILDSQDRVVYTNNPKATILIKAGYGSSFTPHYIKDSHGQLVQIVQPYIEDSGIHRYSMVYRISNASVNQNIASIVTTILSSSILALILMLTLTYILINRLFLRPVAEVSRTALRVSIGDYSARATQSRSDEIGDLAKAVNTMASALAADIAKLKEVDTMKSEFMMISAHNLRSPLTIIRNYLEVLGDELAEDAESSEAIKNIQANVGRLDVFAEDVLTVSTIESGQRLLSAQPMPLQPLLQKIASEFEQYAEQKKITFKASLDISGQANISKPHFRSALWNLLDNAAKFTDAGGTITLDASQKDQSYIIAVTDTGIGIKPEEMPKLFTKFHRATETLRYNYEGVGIGLYLSKIIIEQLGGTIQATSEFGQGSRFTITLPVYVEQASA